MPLSEETVGGYLSSNCYSHDALGNPIDYGDVELWGEDGRRLSAILNEHEGLNVYYTYDSDGLRTSKTVNGVKHEYLYDGDKVVYEKRGEDQFFYYYDSYGHFSAIRHIRASDKTDYIYYANTNSRGDVVGLYTGPGVQIVSYEYDAWGNVISMTDTTNFGLGILNPIRYRGYYYDQETGWYYLQSRYYDPEIGRFINADNMVITGSDLTGLNLFAYCGNNPVSRVDPSGQFWISAIITAAVVVVVAAVVAKVVCTIKETKRVQKELDSLPEPTADITESFRETLKTNADTVKETTKNEGIIKSGKQFYNKVRNQGEWDLKQLPEYQGTFQFNELVIQGQDIGNINFGYTGKALGLPDSVLLAGAGFAQIKAGTSKFSFIMASNGDDLRDQMYIMYGIMLYNEDH